MQKLGQHFLKNAAILQKVVDALALADGDRVIEIGPGKGILTRLIAQKADKVIAVELDRNLASTLASNALLMGASVTASYTPPPPLGINTVTALEDIAGTNGASFYGTQTFMLLQALWRG